MGNCAGLDWASEKHDVVIEDPGGGELLAATFIHDEDGVSALCGALACFEVEVLKLGSVTRRRGRSSSMRRLGVLLPRVEARARPALPVAYRPSVVDGVVVAKTLPRTRRLRSLFSGRLAARVGVH
jgi:hypothetical protein